MGKLLTWLDARSTVQNDDERIGLDAIDSGWSPNAEGNVGTARFTSILFAERSVPADFRLQRTERREAQ
jgi:hypothetical protein